MTRPEPLDVLVTGGGIAGTVAAVAFASRGFATALLDPDPPRRPGGAYAPRVSSINPASESVLAGTGIWRLVQRGRVSPFERIEVFTDDGAQAVAFDAADAGLAHLACIVENDLVAAAARERLDEMADFHALPAAALAEMRRAGELTEVVTTTGDTLACRLLVAADGADSTVRRLAGIGRDVFDYRQQAVVARVVPERHHGATARQKFLATGPLAFLPLADGSCSIVWSLDNESAAGVMSLDDAAFADRLQREFDGRLGRILECERRHAFALRRAHARRYYADGVALVGDACHTVHPLAGLGANQGIADAAALADAASRARDAGQRFFAERVLATYQRRRRPANRAVLAAMDLFHLGFAGEPSLPAELAARLMRLADASATAKRFFIRRAGGLAP